MAFGHVLEARMRGEHIATTDAGPVTLGDVVEALLAGKGLAESTRTDYRRVWSKLTAFDTSIVSTPVSDVDVAWVNKLYHRLAEHVTPVEAIAPTRPKRGPTRRQPIHTPRRPDQWSPHRIRRVHELCAAAWARQVRVGYLDANPFAAAGKPPVERSHPRFPTTKQVGTLAATADRLAVDWADDRRRNPAVAAQLPVYIRLLAMTGARKGELIALRWRHVHLDQHPATIDIFESLSYGSTGGTDGELRSTRRVGLGTGITVRQPKQAAPDNAPSASTRPLPTCSPLSWPIRVRWSFEARPQGTVRDLQDRRRLCARTRRDSPGRSGLRGPSRRGRDFI